MKLLLAFVLLLSSTTYSSALLGNLFGGLFSKDKCPIKLFKDPLFDGVKLYANADTFHPILQTLSTYAKSCHVKLHVKQAFIKETKAQTTIMLREQSALSFRLGEAIEIELYDRDDKVLCNRLCLEKDPSRLSGLPDARCFLRKLDDYAEVRQDSQKPGIIMKAMKSGETLVTLHDKRKELQNVQCKKFEM